MNGQERPEGAGVAPADESPVQAMINLFPGAARHLTSYVREDLPVTPLGVLDFAGTIAFTTHEPRELQALARQADELAIALATARAKHTRRHQGVSV